jgi:hypothetical protein
MAIESIRRFVSCPTGEGAEQSWGGSRYGSADECGVKIAVSEGEIQFPRMQGTWSPKGWQRASHWMVGLID